MTFNAKFLSTTLIACTLQILFFSNCARNKSKTKQIQTQQPQTMQSTQNQPLSSDAINTSMQSQPMNQMPDASQIPVMQPVSTPQKQKPLQTLTMPEGEAKEQQDSKKILATGQKPQVTNEKAPSQKNIEGTLTNTKLDFEVENETGKTIYVVCFSYIKKRPFSRWHWEKSSVYKIEDDKSVIMRLPTIPDEEDRNNTFGYLGVFESQKNAENSIFELLDDNKKIDLDIIAQLHGKKVIIEVEKYGIDGTFYDYDFQKIGMSIAKEKEIQKKSEFELYIENKTGKTVLVTCFVYEKKAKGTWLAKETKESWSSNDETRDDMSVWRFDKTPVISIKPNEVGTIDVEGVVEERDRIYVRGYLAIFDADEKEQAENAIYELLSQQRKLDLGKLIDLNHKRIIIYTKRYGAVGNIIDYVVKPTQKPDIKKIINGYFK